MSRSSKLPKKGRRWGALPQEWATDPTITHLMVRVALLMTSDQEDYQHTVKRLADRLSATENGVKKAVQAMEERGHITRVPGKLGGGRGADLVFHHEPVPVSERTTPSDGLSQRGSAGEGLPGRTSPERALVEDVVVEETSVAGAPDEEDRALAVAHARTSRAGEAVQVEEATEAGPADHLLATYSGLLPSSWSTKQLDDARPKVVWALRLGYTVDECEQAMKSVIAGETGCHTPGSVVAFKRAFGAALAQIAKVGKDGKVQRPEPVAPPVERTPEEIAEVRERLRLLSRKVSGGRRAS